MTDSHCDAMIKWNERGWNTCEIYKDGEGGFMFYVNDESGPLIDIEFCPFCGKKLNDTPKETHGWIKNV